MAGKSVLTTPGQREVHKNKHPRRTSVEYGAETFDDAQPSPQAKHIHFQPTNQTINPSVYESVEPVAPKRDEIPKRIKDQVRPAGKKEFLFSLLLLGFLLRSGQ